MLGLRQIPDHRFRIKDQGQGQDSQGIIFLRRYNVLTDGQCWAEYYQYQYQYYQDVSSRTSQVGIRQPAGKT